MNFLRGWIEQIEQTGGRRPAWIWRQKRAEVREDALQDEGLRANYRCNAFFEALVNDRE